MSFQPTLLGTAFTTEEGSPGMITDETETEVYLEIASLDGKPFKGWSSKEFFFGCMENDED